MAIKLYADRIEIGNFTLMESGETGSGFFYYGDGLGGGLAFTGEARAQFLSYPQQGTVNGWVSSQAPGSVNKYSFATDNGAVDTYTVTPTDVHASSYMASCHSDTHGYRIGGQYFGNNSSKFSFADSSQRFVVGSLETSILRTPGTSSPTHGHSAGGSAPAPSGGALLNVIQRIPFSNDMAGKNVGTLSNTLRDGISFNSNINGYRAGGYNSALSPNFPNSTQKYSFSSTKTSVSVGDCGGGFFEGSEQSSSVESGYYGENSNHKKFPFATDNNTTLLTGSLSYPQRNSPGFSSTTYGYLAGGGYPFLSNIQKFPFASDTTRTNTGNLTPNCQNFGYSMDSHSD